MHPFPPRTKGSAAGTAGAPGPFGRGRGAETRARGSDSLARSHTHGLPHGALVEAGPRPGRQPQAAGAAGMAEPRGVGAPRYLGVAVPKEKPPTAPPPPPAPAAAVEPRVLVPKEKPADMAAAGAAGTAGERARELAARAGSVYERIGVAVAAPQPRMAPAATCGPSGGTERADGRRPRSPARARRGAPRDGPAALKATVTRGSWVVGELWDRRGQRMAQHLRSDLTMAQAEIREVPSQRQETLLE